MKQIILIAIMQYMRDNQGIRLSQHEFMKSRFLQTNLISFYDQMISLVVEGKVAGAIYLDFNKAFDSVGLTILNIRTGTFDLFLFETMRNVAFVVPKFVFYLSIILSV